MSKSSGVAVNAPPEVILGTQWVITAFGNVSILTIASGLPSIPGGWRCAVRCVETNLCQMARSLVQTLDE
ncbi:hypothetical protein [Reticulibacter mediterranei]|uniref:hypothetical protein n=1 Tax=Reticulibacter mediterranei TaxID=2778369 RepID=UPI001C68B0A7|nr:hypothetical protein [Reticulibacter mediterranei]